MTPSRAQIREAITVLGIDPDDLGWFRDGDIDARARVVLALREAGRILDAATPEPVTPDTPNGTLIWHPDYSDDGLERAFIGNVDGERFAYVVGGFTKVLVGSYSDGWSVAPDAETPEPPPVGVGQVRMMPTTVLARVDGGDFVRLTLADGRYYTEDVSTVASWPLRDDQ